MLSFLVLFGLSFMTVCFIFFTILYFTINLQKQQPNPFQKAAEQTVDTILLVPLSWLFTALYICVLFIFLPIRYLLDVFQQKR
ncbi:hypothetical protein P9D34_01755 [Bacillus swezeyi]|uniref:Uncharacterized protein n=1 Tax=Bacillus swezeyi TaxID=1925020 RepID=A0A1R1QWV5_9BACI|nr:hypothetical protein [Bacillus swezeyi]KAA6474773.1 hypothetical protein DX928_12060 [Bacillus swezeyi]MEC1259184.1 hypothetical protein [Bacillus swezeyi]MED1740510.1 hypothetical protein [Bacillus swezeyi]MED2927855.1 hypothetical protein [Bacillus swezeyi]MED2942115.1 hypothetical protein [Bacillus swezeyi]